MKPGFSGSQAFFRVLYPARGSNVLPETVEAPAKESFLVQ
jgi:hypothetical protein